MDFNGTQTINLTNKSISAFDDFLGLVEISKFRRQLRSLLLYYLSEEHEELPSDYGYFIEDMKFMFDFLDVVEDETTGSFEKHQSSTVVG